MSEKANCETIKKKINLIRKKIDKIDFLILKLVQKRSLFIQDLGKIKEESKMPIIDLDREKNIINRKRFQNR